MNRLAKVSRKWWFFLILLLAQPILIPFASKNFSYENIGDIIYTTLRNAIQTEVESYNLYFQAFSLLMLLLLLVLKNKMKVVFNLYIAVSYTAFAFIQNIAVTQKYGISIVTVNLVMFLLVAYVWIREAVVQKNNYDFSNFRWKYLWMILFSLFAYVFPFAPNGSLDWNPLNFFFRNSATAFCLMTPLFLTILTLNLPRINLVAYRITAIIGVIMGLYNMQAFLNPYTLFLGIAHIPLLTVSLYCAILSYKQKEDTPTPPPHSLLKEV